MLQKYYENCEPQNPANPYKSKDGFEKGIPPKVMQEILGHKSITMVLDILCASRQRNPA